MAVMSKNPEEIKKGLETCIGKCTGNKPHCPYHSCGDGCMDTMNRDALTLIRQLEAQIPKWISVDESMPDGFVPVLGHIIDAGNFPHVRECYRVGNAFYFPALRDIHTISHWMPLPEPPKEEEK